MRTLTPIRRVLTALLLTMIPALAAVARAAEPPPVITVFAAASLTESLQELAVAYRKQAGVEVRTSFASSGTLARQIAAGASADVFISADADWMDDLERRRLIVAATRHTLVLNHLVLIAPAGSRIRLRLAAGAPIVAALGGGRLAIADPDSVPAGRYAKAAFQSLGGWQALEPHLVRGEDVRATLAWVARGEAALGVVYATDARVETRVRVVDTFPDSSHPPIVYPYALVRGARPEASGFTAYLASPAAAAVFVRYGFGLPQAPAR